MTVVQGIVVYSMLWWTLIFCVLPFWYHQPEGDDTVDRPKPQFGKIVIYNTLLTTVVWLIIYGLIEANVLDFYKLGQDMAIKDGLQ